MIIAICCGRLHYDTNTIRPPKSESRRETPLVLVWCLCRNSSCVQVAFLLAVVHSRHPPGISYRYQSEAAFMICIVQLLFARRPPARHDPCTYIYMASTTEMHRRRFLHLANQRFSVSIVCGWVRNPHARTCTSLLAN